MSLLPLPTYRMLMDLAPICTVDVLFFNPERTETLLFKRTNDPLKGWYYSAGGRLWKNESLVDCALRQAKREAGMTLARDLLTFGGVLEELNTNSIFPDVAYHAVNLFYGYPLSKYVPVVLDDQHSELRWFSVDDPSLHPYLKQKIRETLARYTPPTHVPPAS